MTRNQVAGCLGVAAGVGFPILLIVFAALDPSYDHGTKAISELGAVGAANPLAWNLTGFLGVGLLLAGFGWGLGRSVADRFTGAMAMLFGLAFAATAIPADMENLRSTGSIAHIVASQLVFLFWLLGLGRLMFVRGAGSVLRVLAVFGLLLAAGSIVLRGSDLVSQAWSQRAAFAVVFSWVLATGLVLWRRPAA
ncbi:MAG: DUF998 domain-containing protein [Caulobacter sp.]|nr:DUF998 domain-containing protein [Caulobacter sp.]